MKKYILQYENGIEVTKKFRSDSEAVAFIDDPRNLRTYGDMNIRFKSQDGVVFLWDKHLRKWTANDSKLATDE